MTILRLILMLMIPSMLLTLTVNGELPAEAKQARALMDKVYEAIQKQNWKDARDNPGDMFQTTEYRDLAQESPVIWEAAMDHLNEIAPSESDRFLLLNALSSLPPKTFLKAVHKSIDLYTQGKLDETALTNYFFFNGGPNWGFFDVNYQNPEVIQILQKLKILFVKDAIMINTLDNILSGDGKVGVENNIRDNPDYVRRSVKAVLLDNPEPKDGEAAFPLNPAIPSSGISSWGAKIYSMAGTDSSSGFPILISVVLAVLVVIGGVFWLRRK